MSRHLFCLKFLFVRIRCFWMHGKYHEYRPIYHSYWRTCSKCHYGKLIED